MIYQNGSYFINNIKLFIAKFVQNLEDNQIGAIIKKVISLKIFKKLLMMLKNIEVQQSIRKILNCRKIN
jgi:hypothetical protein